MENNIEILCREKEQELLDKYFPEGLVASASETIGEYTMDLPLKIEEEYKMYLTELWRKHSSTPLVLEEQKLRDLMTEDDRDALNKAHKDAERRTLWERICKTNHNDVSRYKGLLYEYTKELLTVMRLDFLEEITGKHITGKAFEE